MKKPSKRWSVDDPDLAKRWAPSLGLLILADQQSFARWTNLRSTQYQKGGY